jgi:1-pyrroline-5-carboxylate dehydrogenase
MPEKKVTYVAVASDESIHAAYEEALVKIERELGQRHPMFIGDQDVFSVEEFEVRSPIDRDIVIGHFQKADEQHAQLAISEAKKSFYEWSQSNWRDRMQIIRATAERLNQEKYFLSALITYEVGKNRFEALAEVGEAVEMLRYYCDVYERKNGYVTSMASDLPNERNTSVMKPHGVWAVISPFNFPIALAAGMASAALLTGNTVVFKPTSKASLTGLRLYHAFIKSGLRAGAINVVTGPGGPFGDVAVAHPDVDGISFTGSRAVGMWLQRQFIAKQPYPKPIISEMGSKNPAIVTAYADLDKAVEGVIKGGFNYGGQKCSATSRVYVHEVVAPQFLDKLRAKIKELAIGDPRQREVFMGPIIDQEALTTFQESSELCKRDGGSIIAGGEVLTGGLYEKGYYVRPTIVTGLPRGHRLFKDELFVPFIIIDTFTSLEEALAEANATEFGLTAGIFSEQEEEVERFFTTIQFGVCYSNREGGATTGAWPGNQSFGGWKGSGSTWKGAGGSYYLLSYQREQSQSRF